MNIGCFLKKQTNNIFILLMHQLCFILSFINQCCREFARSRDAQRRVVSGLFICCLKGSVILSFSDSGKLLFTNWSLMRKHGVLQNSSSASSSLSMCVCVCEYPRMQGFCCVSRDRGSQRGWDLIHKEGERGKMWLEC